MVDFRYGIEKNIALCLPKNNEMLKELWGHISMTGAVLKGLPQAKFEISQAPRWIMTVMDYNTEWKNSWVHSDTIKRMGKR